VNTLSVGINSAKNQINTGGYQYDSAGNLTNDPTPLVYTWDAEERLTSVAGVSYTYDGRGRRVEKSSGVMEWYGLDGKLLAETDTSGNLISEFVYFGGRPVARRDSSGSVYYYSGDSVGSVRAVTDSTGNPQLMSEYYPYGGERVVMNNMNDGHKFTGKMRDTESGLDHYDARMLSSTMARWVSVDPGPAVLPNPQSLNRYAYVIGNPTSSTDRNGRIYALKSPTSFVDNYVLSESGQSAGGAEGGMNLCGPDAFNSLVTFEPVPSSSSSDSPSNAGQGDPGSTSATDSTAQNYNSDGNSSGGNQSSASNNGGAPVDPLNLGVAAAPSPDVLDTSAQLPVWAPCPNCQPGCSGSGIPCTLSQTPTTTPLDDPQVQTSYKYTVWDINNNVVSNVTSVNEYFSNTTGTPPPPGQTWVADGSALNYGNVASGQFIDNLGGCCFSATQSFSAAVGNTDYVISTEANMTVGYLGVSTSTTINGHP
jgi:RHS repeat-associated protein